MAKVETIVKPQVTPPPPPSSQETGIDTVLLRPGEIALNPLLHDKARPFPLPAGEERALARLTNSLDEVGQIVPLIVERVEMMDAPDSFVLVDGARRRAAALRLDSDENPFYLQCVERTRTDHNLQVAIRANLDRQGYTALQIAHLCATIRAQNGWEGTAEVAAYLGRSRAYVSQHDKLLVKPAGMAETEYQRLLAEVAAGRMGADAAFWTLTHVDWQAPGAREVIQKASEAAQSRSIAPRGQNEQQQAISEKIPSLSKAELKRLKQETAPEKPQKAAEKAAAAEKASKPAKPALAAPKATKIEKRDVKAAAQATGALKGKPQRGLPELRALFGAMRTTAYPDVMRNFVSLLADTWWRGDASDKEVLTQWGQLAMLVEEAQLPAEDRTDHKKSSKSSKSDKSKSKKH